MWCIGCSYGSPATQKGTCPICGEAIIEPKNPFPEQATGMGSGIPTGKTARKRNRKGRSNAEANQTT